MTRTEHIMRFAAGAAIGYAVIACWPQQAKSQAAPPAGTPAGVNWVNGGRAGGGSVLMPGQTFDQYRYPNPALQPYTLNPGAGYTMLGLGAGAVGSMIGQPVAGGIAAGALGAIAGQVNKSAPPLQPRIVERTAPMTGASAGGFIGSSAPGSNAYNSFSASGLGGGGGGGAAPGQFQHLAQ